MIATAEIEKAEQVLGYMLRASMEECLNLWFGKSEKTDQEIWSRFGADVALTSRGHYDHWALDWQALSPTFVAMVLRQRHACVLMILGDACISWRLALSLTMPNEHAENAGTRKRRNPEELPPSTH